CALVSPGERDTTSRGYCAAARTLARCHPDMGVWEPTLIARNSPRRTISAVSGQSFRVTYRRAVFVTGEGAIDSPGPSDARYAVIATMSSWVRCATTGRIIGACAPLRVPCWKS